MNCLVKGFDGVVLGALLLNPQPHDVPARLIEAALSDLPTRNPPGAIEVRIPRREPKRRCKPASKRLCRPLSGPGPGVGRRSRRAAVAGSLT